MTGKQAPPLGKLTRDVQPANSKLPSPKLKSPTPTPTANVPATPVGTEIVYSAPGVPSTLPNTPTNKFDFSKVGGDAGAALASYAMRQADLKPIEPFRTVESRPDMPVSDVMLKGLAGDESTPFDYTGIGAGVVGTNQVQVTPTEGIARFNSDLNKPVVDPFDPDGSAKRVIENSTTVQPYNYSNGLTQSQVNSRNFFNGLQEWRSHIEPVQLPALQFTPQQLSPGVAGGFSPTAETKGPLSWLVDGQQKDFNPLKLEFGGQGGGILGAAGWVFSRLSPTTYLKGAAMDVARSASSLIEGGSAGLTELFKSGDFNKAYNTGLDAAWENYDANAPQRRGMTQQTFFGNKNIGDLFSSNYTLAAATGMIDLSFSGQGNNPLLTGDASYGVVNRGENFNPFGLREPIRSGFNTGALERAERIKATQAWNAAPFKSLPGHIFHGYDQFGRGALGLLGDIVVEGRIDKIARGAVAKTVANLPPTTAARTDMSAGIAALRKSAADNAPGALVRIPKVPVRDIPDISQFIPKVKPTKGGALARVTPAKGGGITQVVEGEIVESTAAITLRRPLREPRKYTAPIQQRYLPPGTDPFNVPSSRAYTPTPMDISYDAGGALVPLSSPAKEAKIVPAALGVGGKPGGVPTGPRVEVTRVLYAGTSDIPSTTVWDDAAGQFVTVGTPGTRVVTKMYAPGAVPKRIDVVSDAPDMKPFKVDPIQEVTPTPVSKGVSGIDNPRINPGDPYQIPQSTKGMYLPSARQDGFRVIDTLDDTPPADDVWRVLVTKPGEKRIITEPGNPWRVMPYDYTPPTVVPKGTPNYTVQPSYVVDSAIRATHVIDPATGVFVNADELAGVTTRNAPVLAGEKPPTIDVPVPAKDIEYVTAEAISPSLSSADIVRQLTNGADIPGAVYNPRHLQRYTRTIDSVDSLARQVTLPNGVRILDDAAPPVRRFATLQKRVDAAIIASGMDPLSSEAASIRRLFDRRGKPIPDNLSPDFTIEVAGRSVTSPASYVKPAKAAPPDAPKWGVDAPNPDDYVVGVKTTRGTSEGLTDTSESVPGVVSRDTLRDMPVADRQAVVGKSFTDGYAVPQKAIDDVITPDIMTDVQAAKSYASSNIPRESIPPRMDREARTALARHAELVEEAAYTRQLITDVSTQLTDVERNVNMYLKQLDELPDIGVETLTDDVPFSSLIKREIVLPQLADADSIFTPANVPSINNSVPIVVRTNLEEFSVVAGDVGAGVNAAGSRSMTIVDELQLPYALKQVDSYADDFSKVVTDKSQLPQILDASSMVVNSISGSKSPRELQELFERGAFLTPVVRQVPGSSMLNPVYDVLAGSRYVRDYQDAIKASGDSLADRVSVIILPPAKQVPASTTTSLAEEVPGMLYHGTRVRDLNLASVDPLAGAARSEYGTGVWLSNSQDVAMSAAGRAVPANSVPNVNRVFSDDSYVHAVPSDALSTLNIPRASDPLSDSVLNSINRLVTDNKLIFSDVVPYGDDIVEELSSLISGSKVTSYTDLFAKVDDITRNAALRATGAKADEYELTYVQRVITDMLKSSGVDGLKNDLNTVVYDTRFLTAKYVHDVSDIVGDSADEVTLAVHNVNLLKRSYEAEPGSELLRVQLAEANAVAASKVRDAMSDELDELKQLQLKQINDVLDADTDLAKLSSKQRTQEVVRAQMKDDDTVNKFTRELDRGDWNGPCL